MKKIIKCLIFICPDCKEHNIFLGDRKEYKCPKCGGVFLTRREKYLEDLRKDFLKEINKIKELKELKDKIKELLRK